jgi:hypothetical protein
MQSFFNLSWNEKLNKSRKNIYRQCKMLFIIEASQKNEKKLKLAGKMPMTILQRHIGGLSLE